MVGTGPITRLMQINLRDSMRSEVHIINSVSTRRSQCYRVTAKGFADAKLAITKRDLPVGLHFPHLVHSTVLQRRQLLRKRARTWLVASCRHRHVQSFMRPYVIVTVAPFVKTATASVQNRQRLSGPTPRLSNCDESVRLFLAFADDKGGCE